MAISASRDSARSTRSTTGAGFDGFAAHEFGGGLSQLALRFDFVVVGRGILHQRWRGFDFAGEQGFGFGSEGWVKGGDFALQFVQFFGVDVPGRARGGVAQALAQLADFGIGTRQQARDLRFERAGVDDLAERGVGRQRQQVAGYVEGACLQSPVVALLLHLRGLCNLRLQRLEHALGEFVIRRKQSFNRFAVELGCVAVRAEVGHVPAALFEILVPCRPLLSVPSLLVDERDGGQQRQSLDGEGDMGQIGDRSMAVLEIECVEELFGALAADLLEGLLHGER